MNGTTNICRIAKNAINGLERPKYLCREKENENIKADNTMPTIIRENLIAFFMLFIY